MEENNSNLKKEDIARHNSETVEELTDEFLQLYRQLEQEGRLAYFPTASPKESVIGRLMSVPQLKKYREDIDFCRVVRNFLVHTPKVDETYPIGPSRAMVDFLRKLIENIKSPILAIEYAIKINNLYTINMHSNILDVVRFMQTMGFTHVPILEEGKLVGVFSSNVIYSYLAQTKDPVTSFDTELSVFREYLSIYNHTNEYFTFESRDVTLYQVSKQFKIDSHNMKQLAAVFLTENGSEHEKILAMLTPYSILRDAPDVYW